MTGKRVLFRILPRQELLDPQGRAIADALRSMDFPVADVRAGRLIEVVLNAELDDPKSYAESMAAALLVNPVIEKVEIDLLD